MNGKIKLVLSPTCENSEKADTCRKYKDSCFALKTQDYIIYYMKQTCNSPKCDFTIT